MVLTVVLSLVGAFVAGIVCFFCLKQFLKPKDDGNLPLLIDLKNELSSMRENFQNQIYELSRGMNDQLKQQVKSLEVNHQGVQATFGEVRDRLGQLHVATQNMVDIGKDISSLQNILKAPKLRGGLGELLLSDLLQQILPSDHYALQYGFSDGRKVDAAIFLGDGTISVDAKFPLENFRRIQGAQGEEDSKKARKSFLKDVKIHIDSISEKYILPAEGTFDFALMYIPAENVYYELIIREDSDNESLIQYAMERRVIPVSPNSFYAYLQAIARGLRGFRIEKSAQIILESIGQLEKDYQKCLTEFEKAATHLSNTQSAYDRGMKQFEKLGGKLEAIDLGSKKNTLMDSDEESKVLS